ncbi:helicase HerA-like domain-containing protein [Acidobacteriota bacterium]
MNKKRLQGFEKSDLLKYFEKYCIDKLAQRFLRNQGIDTVEDLLALDETEFELLLIENSASRKVHDRAVSLYKKLKESRDKIIKSCGKDRGKREVRTEVLTQSKSTDIDENVASERQDTNVPEEFALQAQPSQPSIEWDLPVDPKSASPPSRSDIYPSKSGPPCDPNEGESNLGDLPPIPLGPIIKRDSFDKECQKGFQRIPIDENGLRRHVLIAGATGSGKTVAARFIIEQAAIIGIPSIVVDAQGDISSLVFQEANPSLNSLYESVTSIRKPETTKEAQDIKAKIEKHMQALKRYPGDITTNWSTLYTECCLPRILTPGWQDLGLPIGFSPYMDVLGMQRGESESNLAPWEITELLEDEVRSLLLTILPKAKGETMRGYEELLIKLFRYAHKNMIPLDGRRGIRKLHELVKNAPEIEPEIFENYLSANDHKKLTTAIYGLQFHNQEKWLFGYQFDVKSLAEKTGDNKTPINIINVKDLRSVEDKKRVLRHIIAGVYKYAIENPKQSGLPSLILYIDEIASGYGVRSIAKQEQGATYRVYEVLSRLVRQARKYGVSVILASQAYTDFSTDIRRQLGTKIIGKVDDSSEQKRVAHSLSDDFLGSSYNPQQFVQRELPKLAPPRLLYINVKGAADTYEQFKCCTLDIVLGDRDIKRWRDLHKNNIRSMIAKMEKLFQEKKYQDSLDQLNQVAGQAEFFKDLRSEVALCSVNLGDHARAERLFRNLEDEDASAAWIDVGHRLASINNTKEKSDMYVSLLNKTLKIAKRINSPAVEHLQLELAKHRLFVEDNPEAANEVLNALGNSSSQPISLFGKAWSQVLRLFPSLKRFWDFFARDIDQETKVITPGEKPLSILITKLPKDESFAEKSFLYTSEFINKPELLKISKLSSHQKSPSLSFEDFKVVQKQQQEKIDKVRTQKRHGQISAAIEALEQYFTDKSGILVNDTLSEEISSYDHDPEIRKARVDDWLQNLDWRRFELETSLLFSRMGYHAQATRPSGDGGVDVRAVKGQETCVIQCKHWKNQKIGLGPVQSLAAAKTSEGASRALLVTSSTLEPGAKRWAFNNDVDVIEGRELVELMLEYCDPERQEKDTGSSSESEENAPQHSDSVATAQMKAPTDLTPKDLQVLELFRSKTEVRNHDVQELLNISRPVAWTRLKRLVDKNYITMNGTKALAYYTSLNKIEQNGDIDN